MNQNNINAKVLEILSSLPKDYKPSETDPEMGKLASDEITSWQSKNYISPLIAEKLLSLPKDGKFFQIFDQVQEIIKANL